MSRQTTYRRQQSDSEFSILNSEFVPRRGYTMAELMIVVIIMIMLVAVTLPVAKKVMDDSHVREASRQLQAYFQMAKARAIHSGRPCGLYLQCDMPLGRTIADDQQPTMADQNPALVRSVTQLYLAEVPAPYSGSTIGATGRIMADPMDPSKYIFAPMISTGNNPTTYGPDNSSEGPILLSMIEDGEKFYVRFDYKGLWYPCQRIGNQLRYPPQTPVPMNINSIVPYPPGMTPPLPATHPGFAYQIRRPPRKVGNPLAMPTGTCIDLRYSGVGLSGDRFPYQPTKAMAVLLAPNGGVEEIYTNNGNEVPNGTLYFLVGKVDKVNDPLGVLVYDIRDSNVADPTSLWVTVGRGNGQVTTSENVPPPVDLPTASGNSVTIYPNDPRRQQVNLSSPTGLGIYLRYCREIATSREQMKGR